MAAESWMELMKVVVRAEPAQATVAPEVKPVPLTVKVKAALPAAAVAGDKEESTGRAALTVKLAAADFWPSGLATTTCAVPAAATSLAGMAALTWVALP